MRDSNSRVRRSEFSGRTFLLFGAVALAATKVLHEANRARRALQGEASAPQEALRRIEQGLTLVHIIQNTVPWTKVKTEIKAGTAHSSIGAMRPMVVRSSPSRTAWWRSTS